ncbi:MAG TPA: TetR/AcrR family transcriptional regulator [Magnetospirillum sp.]|jgi:AcrR family transcriptional regulator|nr:TetR/AcrR family transcriptional regulator [Magnetospirillum sp.]
MDQPDQTISVHDRLLKAARDCFLADDYHNVSTRQIAEAAKANVSMIRYYFGSKEGLYEEMIRHNLAPLLDVLDGETLNSPTGFVDYLRLYYRTMNATPEFPKLILKVLALNHGPGRRFVQQLLERGRTKGAKRVEQMKNKGLVAPDIDADVLRLSFVSLAMTPMLLKDIFEQQAERAMDDDFLDKLARFNGRLIAAGIATLSAEGQAT